MVLAIGIARAQEHEGMDRRDTKLPGVQLDFALAVLEAAAGKPVIVVTVSGGCLSIDELVVPATAIVHAFNPAQQGPVALAHLLFGRENRWGKLPFTIYPGNYSDGQVLQDMSFTSGQGRSYRYFTGHPLFEFGHGLSFTTFAPRCSISMRNASGVQVSCFVENTGDVPGDEVLMLFASAGDDIRHSVAGVHPVPIRKLVEFDRVHVLPNKTVATAFFIPLKRLALTNAAGDYQLYPGQMALTVSTGVEEVGLSITIAPDEERIWNNPHSMADIQ